MRVLISAINAFADVIIMLLFARAICSWFVRPGSGAYRFYQLLEMLTEPIVAPCRRISSRFQTGMFDFSVIIAFLIVMLLRYIIIGVLWTFV
jgi:YggT family protein